MRVSKSVASSELQKRIRSLESKKKEAVQRLQRAEKQRDDGNKYYKGTELPIDDVIFSIREGQLKSLNISIDFYRKDLERRSGRN
jgi:hypothetical protein